MTKYILFSLLMMQGGIVFSQTYTLPSVLFDSMVFEVRKGRSCDSLQRLNEQIIKAQGLQLVNYGNLVELSQGKSATLEALLENQKKSNEVDKMQAELDKKVLKQKVKRRNFAILGETLLIILLLI